MTCSCPTLIVSRLLLALTSDLNRRVREQVHLRLARPRLVLAAHLPQGAAQPYQPQDHLRVLRAQESQGHRGRQGSGSGGQARRRCVSTSFALSSHTQSSEPRGRGVAELPAIIVDFNEAEAEKHTPMTRTLLLPTISVHITFRTKPFVCFNFFPINRGDSA